MRHLAWQEATKRAQRERRDADQAQDRKLLETTRLRSERNKKLKGLLHGVPDGVVFFDLVLIWTVYPSQIPQRDTGPHALAIPGALICLVPIRVGC